MFETKAKKPKRNRISFGKRPLNISGRLMEKKIWPTIVTIK